MTLRFSQLLKDTLMYWPKSILCEDRHLHNISGLIPHFNNIPSLVGDGLLAQKSDYFDFLDVLSWNISCAFNEKAGQIDDKKGFCAEVHQNELSLRYILKYFKRQMEGDSWQEFIQRENFHIIYDTENCHLPKKKSKKEEKKNSHDTLGTLRFSTLLQDSLEYWPEIIWCQNMSLINQEDVIIPYLIDFQNLLIQRVVHKSDELDWVGCMCFCIGKAFAHKAKQIYQKKGFCTSVHQKDLSPSFILKQFKEDYMKQDSWKEFIQRENLHIIYDKENCQLR